MARLRMAELSATLRKLLSQDLSWFKVSEKDYTETLKSFDELCTKGAQHTDPADHAGWGLGVIGENDDMKDFAIRCEDVVRRVKLTLIPSTVHVTNRNIVQAWTRLGYLGYCLHAKLIPSTEA